MLYVGIARYVATVAWVSQLSASAAQRLLEAAAWRLEGDLHVEPALLEPAATCNDRVLGSELHGWQAASPTRHHRHKSLLPAPRVVLC